jgi:HlyD family secretion protein
MKLFRKLLQPPDASLEFAPAILAIQQRPPAPLPRVVLYATLLLFAVVIAWSCIGKLDIVATAQGKLVPSTYLKIVQPADAGIIKEILVHEGDRVSAGQLLLRLDTTLSAADRNIVEKEVELRELQLRRIEAETTGKKMMPTAADTKSGMYTEVENQARARSRAYQDALHTEQSVLDQAQEDLAAAQAQEAKLAQLLPILAKEEESLAALAKDGLVSRFQYAEKQRERIDTEQNLAAQRRTAASLTSRVGESRGRLARVTSDYQQQLLTERVDAQGALDKAREELAKERHRTALSELRAPQDGIIKDVATYTVGAVVGSGTVLMSLVPVQDELVAEVMVSNDDVGFVRVGQDVKVKLAAFPFQRYGMLEGTVLRIAADAAESSLDKESPRAQPEAGQPEVSPYKAIVKLNAQKLRAQGAEWPLAPGMHVVAEIRQGTRTVLEYLLSPVEKTVTEAARER